MNNDNNILFNIEYFENISIPITRQNINSTENSKSGQTHLLRAMWFSNNDAFSDLIKYGADTSKPSKYGEYPMYAALVQNNLFFIEELIKTNAYIPKSNLKYAYDICVEQGLDVSLRFILSYFKQNPNDIHKDSGLSMLNVAAYNCRYRCIEELLKYNVNVNNYQETIDFILVSKNTKDKNKTLEVFSKFIRTKIYSLLIESFPFPTSGNHNSLHIELSQYIV